MTRRELERLSDLLAQLSEEYADRLDGSTKDAIGYMRTDIADFAEEKAR